MTTTIRGLDVAAEGTGISRPLSENVNLLGALLGQVVARQAGPDMLALVEELRLLCKRAMIEDDDALRREAEARIHTLDARSVRWLLQAFGTFFHLVNQAEKQEILRVNRERSRGGADGSNAPRPESIDDAVARLKADGRSLAEVRAALARLDIQPTLTAHPTEARRRAVLHKQRRIAELLSALRRSDATTEEVEGTADALHDEIALLIATDDVRAERPSVEDEIEHGLYFMAGSIKDVAPRIHNDVVRALQRHYGTGDDVPVFLRWRSWIGSDRDGNPNVTPAVTRHALARHRQTALELHRGELLALREELSISERLAPIDEALRQALDARDGGSGAREKPVVDDATAFRFEPYRQLISDILARIDALLAENHAAAHGVGASPERSREKRLPGAQDAGSYDAVSYDAAAYIRDLDLIRTSLVRSGFPDVAAHGRIERMRVLAHTFGFHMAALDVRQHSRVHEAAVAALLGAGGVHDAYAALGEGERLDVLARELRNPRPLLPPGTELPAVARDALETFTLIGAALERDPAAVGSYIISMTHAVSDVLEPMLLAKETGLLRIHDDGMDSSLDFVPLFETIEDLQTADTRMAELFTHPLYRMQLAARGDSQEIMLGYSDSNKDGGYWMANWSLHGAQDRLGRVCREHDIDFRLFHGRGGTVGRGGGRANLAIAAMPAAAHNGRIRVTEQGEVISFRYALPGIAHRHTEQLVSAMLLATAAHDERSAPAHDTHELQLMDDIAAASMRAYRTLIDDERFWGWYVSATPIEQISHLPIASRPVSRNAASDVQFEELRAIPWVFAWTQTRYIVPGWFGIGAALTDVLGNEADATTLQRMYRSWPFFTAVVDNAQREMARARLPIAERYARLGAEDGGCHAAIAADFENARTAILRITTQTELLENSAVIQKSIALRNPYTDVLNLLQLELLQRYRASDEAEREPLRRLLFHTLNGIAAAMQSTG